MNEIFSAGFEGPNVCVRVRLGRPRENISSMPVNEISGQDRSCHIVSAMVATVSQRIGFKLGC